MESSSAAAPRQPFATLLSRGGLMWQRFAVLLVVVLGGCSSSTGPSVNVNGSWNYQASNLAGSGVSCFITGATLSLTQTGSTFSGSYSNAKLTCQVGGPQAVIGTFSGQVVNGLISNDSVSFDFDTDAFINKGTIAGSSMSGNATATENVGGAIGNVSLSGQWGATKG
jgi:hypothetical protein